MEYQWLKTFCIAAETLNFRKAAEILLMSQPSVTVHIKLLEEHIGIQLFERNKNRVTLTPEGKFFYRKQSSWYVLRKPASQKSRHMPKAFEEDGRLRLPR